MDSPARRPGRGGPLAGAVGGVVATVAMTAAMEAMFRRLPRRERYPLPPRELTDRALPPVARDRADDDDMRLLALMAHAGYGAATGALYAAIAPRPSATGGAAYGVLVWAASYCGWIPLAGLLAPATRHPARRNALMVLAHLVWGGVLGIWLRGWRERSGAPFSGRAAPGGAIPRDGR